MNIGVDIDGVLCSEDLFQLTYGARYCYQKNLECPILSPFSKETINRFKWSPEEDFQFWKTNYLYYLTTSEFIYPDAPEIMQLLYQEGHKLYIITQRSQAVLNRLNIHHDMKKITKNWLRSNHIPFHQLILVEESKHTYIQNLKISLMIDDDPEILSILSKTISVIGFRSHSNLQYSCSNFPMVSSWKELATKLKLTNTER